MARARVTPRATTSGVARATASSGAARATISGVARPTTNGTARATTTGTTTGTATAAGAINPTITINWTTTGKKITGTGKTNCTAIINGKRITTWITNGTNT